MEPGLFEEVAAILPGLVPEELGDLRQHVRRYGIKVWFGPTKAPREHYEAQVIGATGVPQAKVLALEVGFHCEYPKEADNEAVIARLVTSEPQWRETVGSEPVVGHYLERSGPWRRVSEAWPDPDLGDGELAFEVAARLTDYVIGLEPIRRA